ncbi:hypothetical protein L9F63_003119, partial [Diploptera punctata]
HLRYRFILHKNFNIVTSTEFLTSTEMTEILASQAKKTYKTTLMTEISAMTSMEFHNIS